MEELDLEDGTLDVSDSSESSEDSDEGQNSDKNANSGKSNFKKLSTALKQERKEKEELKARLSSVESYLLEHSDQSYKPTNNEETNLRLFIVESPEAKEYKDEIKQALLDYPWISLEKAFLLAKATKPQPSKSKTDFDLRSSSKPKDFKSMNDEEAVEKLSASEYLKYVRETWTLKI